MKSREIRKRISLKVNIFPKSYMVNRNKVMPTIKISYGLTQNKKDSKKPSILSRKIQTVYRTKMSKVLNFVMLSPM